MKGFLAPDTRKGECVLVYSDLTYPLECTDWGGGQESAKEILHWSGQTEEVDRVRK
jgi:hypothetical protein